MKSLTEQAGERLQRLADERSIRLGDPCRHITRCADAACADRMIAATGTNLVGIARPDQ